MNGSKNLIMGFCTRQSLRQLAPFIASLRQTTFSGDLCLMIENVASETVDRLRALGVIVERVGPSAQQHMSAMASRYFNYLDFLIRHGERYDKVMLADPSASIFQSDPFGMPLPAEIVYTGEHRCIGETPLVHDAVVQAYGEGVARNIGIWAVSDVSATLATRSGMLRYLTAMAHQLGGRTTPISGVIDQGVHNYVVHMRPLGGSLLDLSDRFAVSLDGLANDAVEITEQGVRVNGLVAPVLSRCDASPRLMQHIATSPRFRLDEHLAPFVRAWTSIRRDAVVAFYQPQRDAGWLELFLGSLNCVSDSVDAHCVGEFSQEDLAVLARFGCSAHAAPATDLALADNLAHFYLNQVLDRIGEAQRDQVFVLDSVRAVFVRDPFLTKTVGLSAFCEGPTPIGDSPYNRDRLGLFVPLDEQWLRQPIVSSAVLRGPLPVIREFYRRMFVELVDHPDLLQIHKVVQGVFNKLCHAGDLGFPVTTHPDGAEVYFEMLQSTLSVDTRHGVRIGGTVPGVVLSGHRESQLVLKARIDLNLPEN